jgi:coenzyme F420-0:L-glutamate ligase/coenzyme F420-1:gamma-L-glutamate ligase
MAHMQIFGIEGLPEIEPGVDLAEMIHAAAAVQGDPITNGDVVVITSKIV